MAKIDLDKYIHLSKKEQVEALVITIAEMEREVIINKAVEWLEEQEEMVGISFQKDFIERFKQAMIK